MSYYDDLIIQWFNRANSEEEIFTKYIFLYITFTAFITQTREKLSDRDRVNVLKFSTEAKAYYLALTDSDNDLKKTIVALVAELDGEPIKNVTRDDDPHWRGEDGKFSDKNDWENIVEFWYRIRNNLFHGHKSPEFDRDKKLVNYAYLTLLPLMKNFIDHNLAWDFS